MDVYKELPPPLFTERGGEILQDHQKSKQMEAQNWEVKEDHPLKYQNWAPAEQAQRFERQFKLIKWH